LTDMRPRNWIALGFLLFVLAEIVVLFRVGQLIGPWWTILLLVAMAVIGSWVIRRQWRGVWTAVNDSVGAGQLPSRELVDAGLVVIGGMLLVVPGFLSDVVGFLILSPLTRPVARRIVLAFLVHRVHAQVTTWTGAGAFGFGVGPRAAGSRIIDGEVLDEPRTRAPSPYEPPS